MLTIPIARTAGTAKAIDVDLLAAFQCVKIKAVFYVHM
jgi:hypothetical protein